VAGWGSDNVLLIAMGLVLRHFLAVLTAAAVFAATANCVCAAGANLPLAVHGERPDSPPHACCAKKVGPGADNKPTPAPCRTACARCQRVAVSESSQTASVAPAFAFAMDLSPAGLGDLIAPRASSLRSPVQAAPPLPAPTLLQLHCALTT
jgi:hypothetical protein